MTVQVRNKDSGDKRWSDPSRDLAHCFPNLICQTAELIDGDKWPVFRKYLVDNNVTTEDLGVVMLALCQFTQACLEKPEDTLDDCLRRSGYYSVSQPAVMAYLAAMGSVVLGGIFAGRRQAYMGEGTVYHPYSLATAAKRFLVLSSIPPWRRKIYFLWKDIRRVFRRLRSA